MIVEQAKGQGTVRAGGSKGYTSTRRVFRRSAVMIDVRIIGLYLCVHTDTYNQALANSSSALKPRQKSIRTVEKAMMGIIMTEIERT